MKKQLLNLGFLFLSFILNAQNWGYTARSTPSNFPGTIEFGKSVSVYGYYSVVGAPGSDNDTGAAFVLLFTGNFWEIVAKLTPSDGNAGDRFGIAVSMYEDTIVVGAMAADGASNESGAAYVFVRPTQGWTNMTETAKLTASDGNTSDLFGKHLDIYNDYIVVGAHLDDDNGTDSGSAYVFKKPASGWTNTTEIAKLLPSDGHPGEYFGHSIRVYNNTIVTGAMWDDVNGSYSGSAYVFVEPSSGWTNMNETAKLLPSVGSGWNYFGNFVDIYQNDIIVGSGTNKGYVFTKPSTGWTNMNETAILTASDGPVDWFANAVSIYDNTIVLGAQRDDSSGTDSGSAYIYKKPISGWANATENQKIVSAFPAQNNNFGHDVCVYDDKIVIGEEFNNNNEGAAYLFMNHTGKINDFTSIRYNIYPNPTNGELKIDFDKVYSSINIQFIDVSGKLISSTHYRNTDKVQININAVNSLYLLKIECDGIQSVYKLLNK